jgi:adenine/guanine phosphoribosyltransferase-like PRPP-binding protein
MEQFKDSHASYLSQVIHEPDLVVATFLERTRDEDFDTIIGTGLSGSLVAPLLARARGCAFAIVRKERSPHSASLIEGRFGQRWIFADDLVASGETKYRVLDAMAEWQFGNDWNMDYVGTYLYWQSVYKPATGHEIRRSTARSPLAERPE